MKFTLKPRRPQSRDHSFHKSYQLGSTVFSEELLFLSPILDQGQLDECTVYSGVATRYNETNVSIDPSGFWTEECSFAGSDGSQGFDIEVPAGTAIVKGFPNYQPTTYFWVTQGNGNDLFDNCRLALQMNQRPLMGGLCWMSEWTGAQGGIISDAGQTQLGGHCIKIAGWTTINGIPYMVLQNSWGTSYGNNGVYYMSREVFNESFKPYGVFFWSDDTNPTVKVLGLISALYQNILALMSGGTTGAYPPAVPTQNLIPQLATGIWEAEGGTLAGGYKLNNPGDIRGRIGNKYQASLGVTGYGENNLAIFPDMATGEKATVQICTDVANNQLLGYPKPCTIQVFVKIYADPQTQAEWNDYVSILCQKVGKSPQTLLSDLL